MTCKLRVLFSCLLLLEHALQSEVPSRHFALCNLLGPPSFNRFVRLFPSIYNCSLREFLLTKTVTQWIFNPSSRKSYCLTFTTIYFHPIFHRPLPPRSSSSSATILRNFYLRFSYKSFSHQLIVSYSDRCSSKYHLRTLQTVVFSKRFLAGELSLL